MIIHDQQTQYVAACGDGSVMLDLETDSYFCRYEVQEPVRADSAPPREPLWHDCPTVETPITARDIRLFLRAWRQAALSFPKRPVRDLLRRGAALERRESRDETPGAPALAARFRRMSLYLPVQPSCLLDSYVLLHFLAAYGRTADWVIGVRLFPFQAHCWLAVGDTLVGEQSHLIEGYVPIYRMGATE